MNPTSLDIKDMLEDISELGLHFSENLYIGMEPSEPRSCVTIFDTPGFPDGLMLDGTRDLEYPSIQIRVRNPKYLDGLIFAKKIKDALHGKKETRNGTLYTVIKAMGGPALLDWDENRNARFIINFNVTRR